MRKFRQYAATTLIVAMMGSTMSVPSLADVSDGMGGAKLGWYLDGEDWYYRKQSGKLRRDEYWYRDQEKAWYGFDDTGRMYENELVRDPNLDSILEGESTEGEITPAYYAYPGGKLAQAKRWILLNDEDGSLHKHDAQCGVDCDQETSWYNFEKEDISGDRYSTTPQGIAPAYNLGRIVVGKEFKDASGKWFGFDNQGRMISRQWARWKNDTLQEVLEPGQAPDFIPPEEGEGVWHYYKYQGERMADGFLPINGSWYRFDKEGNWDGWVEEPAVATPSDANVNGEWIKPDMWMVDSVNYVGDKTVEALPGETVTLDFKVTLASDSNVPGAAPRLKRSRHDFWVSDAKRGSVDGPITVNETAATCTVKYTTSEAYSGEEKLALCIDDHDNAAVVTIITKAPTSTVDASSAVDNILQAIDKDDPNVTASMLKDSLAAVYTGGEEEETNPVIQEAIKKNLVDSRADLKKLSSQYAAEKFITEKDPEVDREAEAILPGNYTVEVAGSALNADKGETVQLKVARGSSEAEAKVPVAENKTRIALDLVLQVTAFDSEDAEDLTELELPVVITITIPAGLKASSVELWHVHDGGTPEEVESAKVSGNRITFAADRFSDYVFVGDPDDGSGSSRPGSSGSDSDSGSSGSSQGSGQWILDAIGWWYRNPDGSYPFNTWHQLMYNSRMDWYHFNQEGYINTGWFTDLDGRVYYLNPLSNGYKGVLLTGWQQIDGFWYYFNQESDGYKGALLTSTVTPDGYQVNEKGQRVQ